MSDELLGAFLRAVAFVILGLAVVVLAEVWGRKRYNRRMKERKETINARRG